MVMKRYKERNGRKKGVAGIIAATMLFAMIFTTGAAYFTFVQFNYQLQNTAASDRNQMELDQSLEQFAVTGVLIDNSIGFKVNNTGPVPIKVVSAFVMNDGGTLYTFMDSLSLIVNSGEVSVPINTNQPYVAGIQYVIKVVTERGNVEVGFYPPLNPSYVTIKALYATLAKGIGSINIEFASLKWLWCEAPPTGWILDGVDQSGFLVNSGKGYPGHASQNQYQVMFTVNVTNYDPDGKDIYLNSVSMIHIIANSGGENIKAKDFPIRKGYSLSNHTYITLKSSEFVYLPWNTTVTLYFGPYKLEYTNVLGPFLSLFGKYEDGIPYAQTIVFEGTMPTDEMFYLYAGATSNYNYQGSAGEKVSIKFVNYPAGSAVTLGFIKRNGREYVLGTVVVPPSPFRINDAFTIPDPSLLDGPGYYVFYVSDGLNTAYATFQITG
jgi:hypothetical protein